MKNFPRIIWEEILILDFGILKGASERIYSATQGTGQEIKYIFNIS